MPRVLLDEVQEHPFEGGRWLTLPAGAGLTDIVQTVRLDDRVAASSLRAEGGEEVVERLRVSDEPAPVAAVGPRLGNDRTLESPFEPALLDMRQVLQELNRCPAGRDACDPLLVDGDAFDLAGDLVAEVVEIRERITSVRVDAASVGSGKGVLIGRV